MDDNKNTVRAPIQDLREWLARIEEIGELLRIDKPVDRDEEMSAISYLIAKQKPSPATLFSKVIGFDNDDKTVGFLKSGVLAGLVVQDPYRMGYDGIKTALAASKKEKVEANVDTGANLVTMANMNDPKIDALINPKVK